MPTVFSNQLKAVLVTDDVARQKDMEISRNKCFTVQHLSYECKRDRTRDGEPFGPTLTSYLDFSIRLGDAESAKVFFERMYINQPFPYSFLFDASFNGIRDMSQCSDAMVATGYIVQAQECYDTAPGDDGSSRQMMVHVRILLCKIDYLGSENVLTLTINQN